MSTTLGTTITGGQVHLAQSVGDLQCILCRFGSHIEPTTADIAELADADCAAVLLANGVAPCRLCGNCFAPKFRARYAAQWKSARAA